MDQLINKIQGNGGFVVTKELESRKDYEHLRKAVEDGTVVRLRQGIYAQSDALANTMIDVNKIVPNGVLCLYSAFMHYGLSTQIPGAYCIAIESKRKVKLPEYPPIDLYYWKKENLEFGISDLEIAGYKVRMTDLHRTICDAVKYRNKIGLDVCGEILDAYIKRPDRDLSLLNVYAEKLRIKKILTLYIETRI